MDDDTLMEKSKNREVFTYGRGVTQAADTNGRDKKVPIVFTDLDGTLLDHETYGCGPALPWVSRLEASGIPLVFNSSKTLAELLCLRREMNNTHPCIAENGSVVAVPNGYFPTVSLRALGFQPDKFTPDKFQPDREMWVRCPGGSRDALLKILHRLRTSENLPFTGFADMDPVRLSRITGLSPDQARLARQRLSTEPILWEGSPAQWNAFTAALAAHGLAWTQGGRFISVSRPFSKKDGVDLLLELYRQGHSQGLLTIGLGDSPNDRAMLEGMDIAVIVKSGRSEQMELQGPGTLIRTTRKGPEGWHQAMEEIFESGHIHPYTEET